MNRAKLVTFYFSDKSGVFLGDYQAIVTDTKVCEKLINLSYEGMDTDSFLRLYFEDKKSIKDLTRVKFPIKIGNTFSVMVTLNDKSDYLRVKCEMNL